jgi:hypothetical protein
MLSRCCAVELAPEEERLTVFSRGPGSFADTPSMAIWRAGVVIFASLAVVACGSGSGNARMGTFEPLNQPADHARVPVRH